jgi:RNA polymerase sigma-70 factor (ECF subfamily)
MSDFVTADPPGSIHDTEAEHLLARVRARDPDALGAFFEQHLDAVHALAWRLVGERSAAEDITQEVFCKVYRAAHQIDTRRDPRPWLLTITYNACREYWRSASYRRARRSVSLDASPEDELHLPPDGSDPESDAIAGERASAVHAALQKLPDTLRAVVVLHEYHGLGHDEIATLTGMSHAAVRKRYSRALSELGRLLRVTLSDNDERI